MAPVKETAVNADGCHVIGYGVDMPGAVKASTAMRRAYELGKQSAAIDKNE